MSKSKVILIIGAVILVVLIFLGYKYYGGAYSGKTTTFPASQVPANSILIQGNSFNPDTLTVKVGTKVTWTNNDGYDHNIVSDDGTTFSSGNLGNGQSFGFTFSKAGTYNYHCAIHTFMTGKVVVTN